MPPTAVAAARDTPFTWEGKDKKGNKIRGKILAVNEQAARADLRRQNIVATRIRKQRSIFTGGGKIAPADIAIFSRQLATWPRASRWCRPSRSSASATRSRRCRS
jgi:type IV pilus assembly protein PilC